MCFLFFLEIGYTSTSRNVEQQLRDQELVIQEMVQVQKKSCAAETGRIHLAPQRLAVCDLKQV